MDLIDKIKVISTRVEKQKFFINTEEATKNVFISIVLLTASTFTFASEDSGDLLICKDLVAGSSTEYKRDLGVKSVLNTLKSITPSSFVSFYIEDVEFDPSDGMVTVRSKDIKCSSGAEYSFIIKTTNKKYLELDRGSGVNFRFSTDEHEISVYENFIFDGSYILKFRHKSFGSFWN